MSFAVKSTITLCDSFQNFLDRWKVGRSDLIITNEYVLSPHLGGNVTPCDTLYQEKFGKGEPSDEMVDAMLSVAGDKEYERIIAIGGGTVIDIAKLFVFGSGLRCEEIFKGGTDLPRRRNLVIIPTTCGTGSEVTSLSIIEFKAKQTKLGLGIPALLADEAVLIPSMLATLPYGVFAASSIDALIHAVESYVSPKADAFTRSLGKTAIEMILRGYRDLVADGGQGRLPADMADFLTASTMAGIAFGNAGVGAVHALSYPIGGGYHIPHGNANYMMFQAVFTAYRQQGADLSLVEKVLAEALDCTGDTWTALFSLLDNILTRQPLRALGVGENECLEMAESVIKNQQRLLANNPVALNQEVIADIYRGCD